MAKKQFYVVHRGAGVNEPTLFSSWEKVHKRVSGHSNARYKGYTTLEDALKDILSGGFPRFFVDKSIRLKDSRPRKGSKPFYVVAHGKVPGIYHSYGDSTGAKPQVDHFPHACHKAYGSYKDASHSMQELEGHTQFRRIDITYADEREDDLSQAIRNLSLGPVGT